MRVARQQGVHPVPAVLTPCLSKMAARAVGSRRPPYPARLSDTNAAGRGPPDFGLWPSYLPGSQKGREEVSVCFFIVATRARCDCVLPASTAPCLTLYVFLSLCVCVCAEGLQWRLSNGKQPSRPGRCGRGGAGSLGSVALHSTVLPTRSFSGPARLSSRVVHGSGRGGLARGFYSVISGLALHRSCFPISIGPCQPSWAA